MQEQYYTKGELLKMIPQTNDLNLRWNLVALCEAFRFPTRVQRALLRYFGQTPITQEVKESCYVSIRQLMDLLVSGKKNRKTGYLIVPILDLSMIGDVGFWQIVRLLSEVDLGEQGNREWRWKLSCLRSARRIQGHKRYGGSSPVPLEWRELK